MEIVFWVWNSLCNQWSNIHLISGNCWNSMHIFMFLSPETEEWIQFKWQLLYRFLYSLLLWALFSLPRVSRAQIKRFRYEFRYVKINLSSYSPIHTKKKLLRRCITNSLFEFRMACQCGKSKSTINDDSTTIRKYDEIKKEYLQHGRSTKCYHHYRCSNCVESFEPKPSSRIIWEWRTHTTHRDERGWCIEKL